MSTQEGIDELIARHKEALKRVEESKSFFNREKPATTPQLPFADRVRAHLRSHSNTWSTVISMGCILVLSLRLVSLRRDFAEARGKLEAEQEALQNENSKFYPIRLTRCVRRIFRLRSYVEQVEGSWETILREIRSGGWRSASLVDRVEKIIAGTRPSKTEPEPTPKPKNPKKPKDLFI